jgi:exodeoxyribonuclease-3
MRLVAWNCNMALHRKSAALLALAPDIAVLSECAAPARLAETGALDSLDAPASEVAWIGRNPHKGLAVLARNGYRVRLDDSYRPGLDWIAPVRIDGPAGFNLLAVWAQNFSGGVTRKHQVGPLRRALSRYRPFLAERSCLVAGDFNHNVIWDKPGWRNNHAGAVERLAALGLVSAYHALRGEAAGAEREPTLYWRDRAKHGPTYHIDYVFLPRAWLGRVRAFAVGSFEDWCGAGLSDHAPLLLDLAD